MSGRTLIYTFGFFSILLFGGVSLCAGAVTVAIFKDICIRCNVAFLTSPWLATIIWGSLYYTWMCVIANVSNRVEALYIYRARKKKLTPFFVTSIFV